MYSVKINLIGCDEDTVSSATREILQRWAVIDVDYPNVTAVHKNVLIKEDETRLFIIHIRSADDLSELKRLNSSYPRYPILAVVDTTSDPTLVVRIMRAGVMQVVHAPVLPDDLKEALDCIAVKHDGLSKLAKLVTVTSSVGGCGGTTVAINLTYELARLAHARCILLELLCAKAYWRISWTSARDTRPPISWRTVVDLIAISCKERLPKLPIISPFWRGLTMQSRRKSLIWTAPCKSSS